MRQEGNQIYLNESELTQIVNQVIEEQMLKEGWWDKMKGGAQTLGQMGQRMSRNGLEGFSNMNSSNFRDGMKKGWQAVKAGAQNGNVQGAINQVVKSMENFVNAGQAVSNVVGPKTMQAIQKALSMIKSAGGRSQAGANAYQNSAMQHFGVA